VSAGENKRLIADAFDAWAKGDGNFFDLLADDATWTIPGSSPIAGTYHGRQEFLDRAIQPIGARLAKPIRPTVHSIVAEDDTVAVMWEGHAVALDGRPYDNRYSWVMRLQGGRITEATAFFDAPAFTDLWERVSPRAT
jgi:uncharacterized protein